VTVFKRQPLDPIQNLVHGFFVNILSVKHDAIVALSPCYVWDTTSLPTSTLHSLRCVSRCVQICQSVSSSEAFRVQSHSNTATADLNLILLGVIHVVWQDYAGLLRKTDRSLRVLRFPRRWNWSFHTSGMRLHPSTFEGETTTLSQSVAIQLRSDVVSYARRAETSNGSVFKAS
jgi:hypothetical protein